MTKQVIAKRVAEKAGINFQQAERAYNAVFETLKEALADGERIGVQGFGTFEIVAKPARMGRNPQTGEEMEYKAHNAVHFKPSTVLKNVVNEK